MYDSQNKYRYKYTNKKIHAQINNLIVYIYIIMHLQVVATPMISANKPYYHHRHRRIYNDLYKRRQVTLSSSFFLRNFSSVTAILTSLADALFALSSLTRSP